jgi:hypothetical protein
VPGISVKAFPGHTAHMQAIIVNGHPGSKPSSFETAAAFEKAVGFEKAAGLGTTPGFVRARLPAAPSATHEENGALAPEATTACYISDLIPTTAHIDLTWGMSFDLYPLQTIESRKQYYAKAIPEKWLTVFTHDPKTPWAYVEKDETGKMVAREVTCE